MTGYLGQRGRLFQGPLGSLPLGYNLFDFGVRASEAGLIELKDLESLLEGSDELQLWPPKTRTVRYVLVTEDFRQALRKHHAKHLCILRTAHQDQEKVCLAASLRVRPRVRTTWPPRDWSTGLHEF
jgi:hypothetical protein